MFDLSFETLEYLKIVLDIILGIMLGFIIHTILTRIIDKVYNVYNIDGDIKLQFVLLPSCFIVLTLWGIITWMR